MIYVLGISMVMLVIAAALVIIRAVKGPTALDRMVSVDMISSITIGAVALLAALTRRADLLALFIVLALVGFVGSTTLARFITPLDPSAKRILSREEERALDAEMARRSDDDAPIHDVDFYGSHEEGYSGADVDPHDAAKASSQHGGAAASERPAEGRKQ